MFFAQIVVEEFLEDINNILNSGEVPNLFESDEYEKLIIGCRAGAKEAGIAEGNRDAIFEFCINRVRYTQLYSAVRNIFSLQRTELWDTRNETATQLMCNAFCFQK